MEGKQQAGVVCSAYGLVILACEARNTERHRGASTDLLSAKHVSRESPKPGSLGDLHRMHIPSPVVGPLRLPVCLDQEDPFLWW